MTRRGVGERFADIDLRDLPAWLPEGYRLTAQLLRAEVRPSAVLSLIGPRGVGKTAIACAIVRDLVRDDVTARRISNVNDMMHLLDVRATPRRREVGLFRPKFLVIDEYQLARRNLFDAAGISKVILRRAAAGGATLLVGTPVDPTAAEDVDVDLQLPGVNFTAVHRASWPRIHHVHGELMGMDAAREALLKIGARCYVVDARSGGYVDQAPSFAGVFALAPHSAGPFLAVAPSRCVAQGAVRQFQKKYNGWIRYSFRLAPEIEAERFAVYAMPVENPSERMRVAGQWADILKPSYGHLRVRDD